MKVKLSFLFIVILAATVAFSCTKEDYNSYYVRYVAEAAAKTDTTVYHRLYVYTTEHDITSRSTGDFYVKGRFDQIFGPYKSGQELYIMADSPNMDTYMTSIFVKKGRGEFQLVSQNWNNAYYRLP